MSRFRVGQRVRFARSSTHAGRAYEGHECTVVGAGLTHPDGREYEIRSSVTGHGGWVWGWQLEPILDDDTRALGAELLRRWTGEGVAA